MLAPPGIRIGAAGRTAMAVGRTDLEQGGGGGSVRGWSSEATAPSPPCAGDESYAPSARLARLSAASHASPPSREDRLARLSAVVARAGAASSSPSSRYMMDLNVAPSFECHRVQDLNMSPSTGGQMPLGEIDINVSTRGAPRGQRDKKRKSPCAKMPLFRSPLSRMLLSPRIPMPRAQLGSPSGRHRTSPSWVAGLASSSRLSTSSPRVVPRIFLPGAQLGSHSVRLRTSPSATMLDIDLNMELQENVESGSDPEGDPHAQQNDGIDQENAQENAQESDENDQENNPSSRKNVVVRNEKRRAIFEALLARARNGFYLKGHDTREVSVEFSVPLRTVQRIWKKGKSYLDQGLVADVSNEKSKCGRKKIEVDVSILRDVPLSNRTTIDDVAKHLGVSKSKVFKMKREGVIKHVSSTIKPYLTEKNKKERLKWCLSMLDPRSVPHNPMFKGLFDYVFIDEKWFYITRKTERYYIVCDEEVPVRTCKNKNYIPKIQFLTALARPRFDTDGGCTFDGKIGCFPFVTYERAKRSSVNRPAGTVEMKPIDSITKDVMRAFMIEKVLPAIRAKWPCEDVGKPIYIQQDNAKPHVGPNDRSFSEAAKQDGFDMRLVCQPANSPDFNILDLGFFNSIQSIQHKQTSNTTEELVAVVNQAFEGYSANVSNRIFLTLHACMKEVMKIGGGNGYDGPHIRKEMLERQGRLPLQLKCDALLFHDAMAQTSE